MSSRTRVRRPHRWDRPRHPRDGCPADRRDGPCGSAARRAGHQARLPGSCPCRGYGTVSACPHRGEVCSTRPISKSLVNALCGGVLRQRSPPAHASGVGNSDHVRAATGGDGIGGASILASESFDDAKPTKRPSVPGGGPVQGEALIECTLELFPCRDHHGIQDFVCAGISCATSELASAGDGGCTSSSISCRA